MLESAVHHKLLLLDLLGWVSECQLGQEVLCFLLPFEEVKPSSWLDSITKRMFG